VLVIDDETDVADMVADVLADDGHRVVTANSGR
jgi:CheY-like chemotaxis protein